MSLVDETDRTSDVTGTDQRAPAVSPGVAREAVVAALRLALGRELPAASPLDWGLVLAVAIRERLGGVAWLRSGGAIRSAAPRDVVDRWRTLAVVMDRRGRERLELLTRALGALEAEGCRPMVLKGMPLSQRLYGDPFVRASDDIDLLVGAADRARAKRALMASGWRHVEGEPPWDELFASAESSRVYLEVHESLLTDYLAHVRMPEPAADQIDLGQCRPRSFTGPMEPAYLAAHLAGHQLPPLLWAVDFLTVWSRLDRAERDAATRSANQARLGRYLEWGVRLASSVTAAADGDLEALMRLGVRGSDRVDAHLSIWRHASLASNPLDASRVIGACVWPRPIRWGVGALIARLAWAIRYRGYQRDGSVKARGQEVIDVAGGALGVPGSETAASGMVSRRKDSQWSSASRHPSAPGASDGRNGFKLAGSAALDVVREAIAVAGFARVRAAGTSMWPTLRNGSLVTVVALPATLRAGQIVLLDCGGMPVLHRIVTTGRGEVQTAGDACLQPDPATPLANVRALAICVSDDRGTVTLVGSLEYGARSWLLYAAARTRLALARAWRRLRVLQSRTPTGVGRPDVPTGTRG